MSLELRGGVAEGLLDSKDHPPGQRPADCPGEPRQAGTVKQLAVGDPTPGGRPVHCFRNRYSANLAGGTGRVNAAPERWVKEQAGGRVGRSGRNNARAANAAAWAAYSQQTFSALCKPP